MVRPWSVWPLPNCPLCVILGDTSLCSGLTSCGTWNSFLKFQTRLPWALSPPSPDWGWCSVFPFFPFEKKDVIFCCFGESWALYYHTSFTSRHLVLVKIQRWCITCLSRASATAVRNMDKSGWTVGGWCACPSLPGLSFLVELNLVRHLSSLMEQLNCFINYGQDFCLTSNRTKLVHRNMPVLLCVESQALSTSTCRGEAGWSPWVPGQSRLPSEALSLLTKNASSSNIFLWCSLHIFIYMFLPALGP